MNKIKQNLEVANLIALQNLLHSTATSTSSSATAFNRLVNRNEITGNDEFLKEVKSDLDRIIKRLPKS